MTTNAVHARASRVAYGDGASPEAFTVVAEQIEVSAAGAETERIDVTNHDTDAGEREHIAGDRDSPTVSFTANALTETTHQALETKRKARTVDNWRIVWATGEIWVFPGYVSMIEMTAPASGSQLIRNVSLQATGDYDVTWP